MYNSSVDVSFFSISLFNDYYYHSPENDIQARFSFDFYYRHIIIIIQSNRVVRLTLFIVFD